MKRFLNDYGLLVLLAMAVVSMLLALLSIFSRTSSPLTNLANLASTPFRAAYTSMATWFNDKQNYYKNTTDLEKEVNELRQRVAEMEQQNRQAVADSAENERLRELLRLRPKTYELELECASVTEHTSSNWTSSLTLNKGRDHGIDVRDCVIDQTYSLVGLVEEVGTNWCTILTLVDTETSLGAQVFRSKELGLAEGDFALMEQGLLYLNYLPADCVLLNGDLVQTSGLGGFIPSGLNIGTVEEVQTDDASSSAILKPSADFSNITEVFVVTDFHIAT